MASAAYPRRPWSHAPTSATLAWLAVSLPLVAWDTGYLLLRPHSMPGGRWHRPIWAPYEIYGRVDLVYGWRAYHAGDGFPAAQAYMNCIESVLYGLYIWLSRAAWQTRRGGAPPAAALVGFSAALMTLSKTILYAFHEYCAGFDNIRHNDLPSLVLVWIIPNGAWLVFSAYMAYSMGSNIAEGLALAAEAGKSGKEQ